MKRLLTRFRQLVCSHRVPGTYKWSAREGTLRGLPLGYTEYVCHRCGKTVIW